MPMRAAKPCSKPGCRTLVYGGGNHCEAHITDTARDRARKQYDVNRVGAEHRGIYSSKRWRSLRQMKLNQDPFCELADLCVKRTGHPAPATVVDHIKAVIDEPDLAYEWTNLRSCCKPCHDSRTAREQGFAKTKPPNEQAA